MEAVATFEVTLAGDVDALDLGAIQVQFEEALWGAFYRLCRGRCSTVCKTSHYQLDVCVASKPWR